MLHKRGELPVQRISLNYLRNIHGISEVSTNRQKYFV